MCHFSRFHYTKLFYIITVPYRTHPGAQISEILYVTPGNPGPRK